MPKKGESQALVSVDVEQPKAYVIVLRTRDPERDGAGRFVKPKRKRKRRGGKDRVPYGRRHYQWGANREVIPVPREQYYLAAEDAHPMAHDLWTPITPQMVALLEELKEVYGTWRMLTAVCGMGDGSGRGTRQLRRLRQGKQRCVSMTVWDRILTATGREYLLEDYYWFTPVDLMKLGLWKPIPFCVGKEAYVNWD